MTEFTINILSESIFIIMYSNLMKNVSYKYEICE